MNVQAELYRSDDAAVLLNSLSKLPAGHHASVMAALIECCRAKATTVRLESRSGWLNVVVLSVKAASADADGGAPPQKCSV